MARRYRTACGDILVLHFSCFQIYRDNAAYRAGNRQGDKVYPTERNVFERRESGEYQKREQHLHESAYRAFDKSVLWIFERKHHAYEQG